MAPQAHYNYKLGVPYAGEWVEILNTDDTKYAGSGIHNVGVLKTIDGLEHGREQSILLTLAPLSTMVFELTKEVKMVKKIVHKSAEKILPEETTQKVNRKK
jgi:1,4-alpha-glucan branching enzyme